MAEVSTYTTHDPSNLHFLVLNKYHLSVVKATQCVIETLVRAGVSCPQAGWRSIEIGWNDGTAGIMTFTDLVKEARRNGIIPRIQRSLDKQDPVFGGTIDSISSPNRTKAKTQYAGWEKEVEGPFRSACVELELVDDILDYRRQACEHSNEHDFFLTARYFRGYLSACLSLLDAFVNRHILLAKHDGFSSPEFDRLKVETNLEEKMRLWWAVCSDDDPVTLFSSQAWCHFQQLRTVRNEILHAVHPMSVYVIKEIQVLLNRVRSGLGELLLLLRQAHKKPTLGFIERLRTAPIVDYCEIEFQADEQHIVKRVAG